MSSAAVPVLLYHAMNVGGTGYAGNDHVAFAADLGRQHALGLRGLATIVARGSIAMLGDSPATFGDVGEPRSRAAILRAGFVDTDRAHIMVVWRKELAASERKRLVDLVEALGPF